jgi:hypothetical protein
MTTHLFLTAFAVPLLALTAQQPPQQPKPNPFNRPIIVPLQPRDEPPRPAPKPNPPPKGIEVPKRKTDTARPNPAVGPTLPRFTAPVDMSDWTKVAPAEAGFAIYMPEMPDERRSTVRAGERNLDLVQYVLSMDEKGAYLVMFSELPAGRTTPENAILRAARDRIVESLRGRLLNEDRIQQGQVSGIEIQVRANDGNVIRQQIFVVANRLVQAIASGPEQFVNSSATEKYFRSLRFDATGETR